MAGAGLASAGSGAVQAAQQQQNQELRTALNDAYAAVQGAAGVQTFAAYTFENALQDQINLITLPGTDSRPNEIDGIQTILSNLLQAVTKIKAMPPSAFAEPSETSDVNTPP